MANNSVELFFTKRKEDEKRLLENRKYNVSETKGFSMSTTVEEF
jgi:hypothetical protein